MAKTPAHASTSIAMISAFARRLPQGWCLASENPIALDPDHAPLPDLCIIRADDPFVFAKQRRHPGPGDVGLVIEIAVTSLPRDLGKRCEQYARALVPVYWVADVSGRKIVIHEGPRVVNGRGDYERVLVCEPGKTLQLSLRGQAIEPIPYEEVMR
jgi:Uma2 family endonuclease